MTVGELEELIPLKAMTWLVASAVNVPMANWPTPPTVLVVLSSSVTEFVAVAVVSNPVVLVALEAFSHHSNSYCCPMLSPVMVKVSVLFSSVEMAVLSRVW